MPILKTEILGSIIEINYEEKEKNKLLEIIEKFNDRLLDFKSLEGKVSINKIMLLAALKAEDQIVDLLNEVSNKEKENINNKNQSLKINDLNQEIIKLKDNINELNNENLTLENLNSRAFGELDNIEKHLRNLINKIIAQNNEEN